MDNQTNDRDTGRPQTGTPEELEEALKWLEELTARQGKTAELSNPVPPTSLDSPFHGLIDNDEGELPDWLREVPGTDEPEHFGEEEPESRLDWLARMAQRESIEELPTLEWRRLSDPMQSALAPDHQQIINETIGEESELEKEDQEFVVMPPVSVVAEPAETPASPPVEAAGAETVETNEPAGEITAGVTTFGEDISTPIEPTTLEDLNESITLPDDEELPSLDDLDAAMAWIEELAVSQEAPIEDVPSVADRALASKLMIEAGITPVLLPLDELGSDSDLIENLTPTHPFIEEEDFADTVVLVETMAADQGMALDVTDVETPVFPTPGVEEPVADKSVMEVEDMAVAEPPTPEASPDDPSDKLSFEDAMAYLDELAVEQPAGAEEPPNPLLAASLGAATVAAASEQDIPQVEEPAAEVIVITEADALIDESLSIDDAPWKDDVAIADDHEMTDAAGVAESEATEALPESAAPMLETAAEKEREAVEQSSLVVDMEATLSALDALALPPGKTLDTIGAALRAADGVPGRDVAAALAWLEDALAHEGESAPAPETQLDEEALIAQMPDDPDAVLAWLEQMAGEESNPAEEVVAVQEQVTDDDSPARHLDQLATDFTEADLLDMPEDPDEAMLWLESLARGSERRVTQSVAPDAVGPVSEEANEPAAAVELPEELGAFVATEPSEPAVDEPPAPPSDQPLDSQPPGDESDERRTTTPPAQPEPPTGEKRPGSDWIDLLKPLE